MSRDILSMIGKSKASVSKKPVSSQAQSSISSLISSKSSSSLSHRTSIIDEYLIKVTPINPTISDSQVPIVTFDLDGTLIHTKSGSKFASSASDWKWLNNKVITKLHTIHTTTPIVIFTNQGGVIAAKTSKSYVKFTEKIQLILKELEKEMIDTSRVWIYASPKKPAKYKGQYEDQFLKMRKPQTGMFESFLNDYGEDKILMKDSSFIGDAAGRANDFSDSDLNFAKNCKLDFKTPEEYFK